MRLADFYNLTNFDIEDAVMSTIGGVAFRLFDRLPEPGDQINHDGFRFIVKQRSGLRISELQVQKIATTDQPSADAVDKEMVTVPELDEAASNKEPAEAGQQALPETATDKTTAGMTDADTITGDKTPEVSDDAPMLGDK